MATRAAVQMYTLRTEAGADYFGTLDRVAAIGYEGVELAGWGGLTATKMAEALSDRGIVAAACHVPLPDLEKDLPAAIDYCLEIGCEDLVCPYAEYADAEAYLRAAEKYAGMGRACEARGIHFSYHNHAHELEPGSGPAGERGLDSIYRIAEPRYLKAEIDSYWVAAAGLDPIEYFHKYSGRSRLLHLKDMGTGPKPSFAALGEGRLDLASLVSAALRAETAWLIVEQDLCPRDPFDCIAASLAWLRKALARG